jgi:hypothetical protein
MPAVRISRHETGSKSKPVLGYIKAPTTRNIQRHLAKLHVGALEKMSYEWQLFFLRKLSVDLDESQRIVEHVMFVIRHKHQMKYQRERARGLHADD